MYVLKRNGQQEIVQFDKITSRIRPLCEGLNPVVDPVKVTQKVVDGVYAGVTTSELDNLAAETCAYMSQSHPDFSVLAARIAMSNLHKNTLDSFWETTEQLRNVKDARGNGASLLSDEYFEQVSALTPEIENVINYERDFTYDYFGFKTLEKSYLLRDPLTKAIIERPQHLLLRVAIGIHYESGDLKNLNREEILNVVSETYNLLSLRYFTHATPTLFNAGTMKPQLSSCFLLTIKEDSIDGIYETLKNCAQISKTAGGIGLSISHIRGTDSYIRGTNGFSNGIVPMLRVFNNTARYVDQGGGKRKGSFAIYLEPWHLDVFDFLELKLNRGKDEARARDLFYALWIPDLFMERVKADEDWALFCPNNCPDLIDLVGDEFTKKFIEYEQDESIPKKVVRAQSLWFKILETQVETGTPYMLYKDAANLKSNQQNLGTIRSSNLCTEIVEYTSADEIAVCNLASIALPMFVRPTSDINNNGQTCPNSPMLRATNYRIFKGNMRRSTVPNENRDVNCPIDEECHKNKTGLNQLSPSFFDHEVIENRNAIFSEDRTCFFDLELLRKVTTVVTRNLNKIIDKNYYPVEAAKRSNMRHRPIGIGVQGLADAFCKMKIPFESTEALVLNRDIFETIYFASVTTSSDIAIQLGETYSTFQGSPASQGKLQFDLWNMNLEYAEKVEDIPTKTTLDVNKILNNPKQSDEPLTIKSRWNWPALKDKVKNHGLINSLLIAPMPTASTAQVLGNNESFEPYTQNIYVRRVLSGEFVQINKFLVSDLMALGKWNDDLKQKLVAHHGSVLNIEEIPNSLKSLYKTVWEIKQKHIIDMAVVRGPFVDQSQSLNIHMVDVNNAKLSSMHFYGWSKGLKTGMYYLRTKPAVDAIQFTVNPELVEAAKQEKKNKVVKVGNMELVCESCSG